MTRCTFLMLLNPTMKIAYYTTSWFLNTQQKNRVRVMINKFFPLSTFHLYVATFQHLHMEYISLLKPYSRACGSYQDYLDRGLLHTRKLLNQGFLLVKLKSLLRKFYGDHHDLVVRDGMSVSQMTTDMFHLS